jgi:hypothetical protein
MTGRIRIMLLGIASLAVLGVGTAYALNGEIGNTKLSATATMLPRELPAKGGAPIELSSITRIGTKDGKPPPVLESINFLIDGNGFIEAKGVPVCTVAKLEGTTPAQARKVCAGSLVGTGLGKAVVSLPGQPQRKVSSQLSFFNGPKLGGMPSMIAHGYETVPKQKTLLVPIPIKKVNKGRYGFELEVQIPPIAEGDGSPTLAEATIGRTFKRGGKEVGYLNARCSGGRLQVQGALTFANGDFFPTTLTSPCHLPR